MKKFKSLMLAALASAALAAPSFADGHSLKSSGEVVVGMKYSSSTPDGGDTTTTQEHIGDVNMKLSSKTSGALNSTRMMKVMAKFTSTGKQLLPQETIRSRDLQKLKISSQQQANQVTEMSSSKVLTKPCL